MFDCLQYGLTKLEACREDPRATSNLPHNKLFSAETRYVTYVLYHKVGCSSDLYILRDIAQG